MPATSHVTSHKAAIEIQCVQSDQLLGEQTERTEGGDAGASRYRVTSLAWCNLLIKSSSCDSGAEY